MADWRFQEYVTVMIAYISYMGMNQIEKDDISNNVAKENLSAYPWKLHFI